MIKRRFIPAIALAMISLGGGGPFAGLAGAQSELPLKVVTVAGQGEIYRASTSKSSAAALRVELGAGDGARTLAGGRLTLRTTSGQSLRLGARSRLSVAEPAAAADQPTRVKLEAGALWVAVLPGSPPRESVEVQTGAVTVTVRGSGVWVTLNPDGAVQVRVFHGSAECSGPGPQPQWTRPLPADREVLVSAAGIPGPIKKLDRDKVQAEWTKWNEEQDVAGGYSTKPPEP